MNENEFRSSNSVPLAWSRGLAKAGLGCFLLFAIVHITTGGRLTGVSSVIYLLTAIEVGFPMLILCMVSWWRRKMTWWSWSSHLVAMLLNAALMYIISRVRSGGRRHQTDLGAGLAILELLFFGFVITIFAILIGFGMDWMIHRYRRNRNIA